MEACRSTNDEAIRALFQGE
ncbi:hypothetical protein A2U01_0093971, partial [Trifolium medium]|nr:hypothetical protein [Trifolium medium]